MGYIYKITNKLNNKVYIGQTRSARPTDRYAKHKYIASHLEKEKYVSLIHRAMNKYGLDNFTFEIIEEVEVQKVQENSIAEQIGFQNGDIIKSVSLTHNEEVTNLDITRYFQLIDFFLTVREGDTMQFTIMGTQGETTLSYTFGIEDFVAVK